MGAMSAAIAAPDSHAPIINVAVNRNSDRLYPDVHTLAPEITALTDYDIRPLSAQSGHRTKFQLDIRSNTPVWQAFR